EVCESDIVYGAPSIHLDVRIFDQPPQRFCIGEEHSTLEKNDNTQTNTDDIQPAGVMGITPIFDFFDDIHNRSPFRLQNKRARFLFEKRAYYFGWFSLSYYFLIYITSFTALTTRPTLGKAACTSVDA